PFGSGEVEVPVDARMMFVQQQSYLPIGTIKAALAYPAGPDQFKDADYRTALNACGLSEYETRLDDDAHWQRTLSPG
ncbi:ABC transporter ATP-binding protein/permease, partial [Klebsiella pneumoniae]|nr:ABC transporter ATP-binding protein/permease [Klebsiella pneumoniae]